MRQSSENNFMSSIKTIRCSLTDFSVKISLKKDTFIFLPLFFTLIYKNAAFSDTISRFYTHLELDMNKLRAKFQLDISRND